jgi:putative transposase
LDVDFTNSAVALKAAAAHYGPEMVAKKLRGCLARVGAKSIYITLGSPWGNRCWESFNGKLRNELLNGEIFYTWREAQVVIDEWRQHYNRVRPHSAIGYRRRKRLRFD